MNPINPSSNQNEKQQNNTWAYVIVCDVFHINNVVHNIQIVCDEWTYEKEINVSTYHCHCWLVVNWPFRNKLKRNFNPNTKHFFKKYAFEMSFAKRRWNCSGFGESFVTWRLHQMETFSALLAFCARNTPVTGEFPWMRPVTRSFGVFFDQRLNIQLCEQSWGWWFDTPSCSLWRHCNEKET